MPRASCSRPEVISALGRTEERVVLVDPADREIGTEEKLRAHRTGQLHRAFSVFIFGPDDMMLLQRRALSKYHSGGLWSNACCSHPRPGESTSAAAHRRLGEELGFDCTLTRAFDFVYHADLGGGLFEHEYDHVFVGNYQGIVSPNRDEVDDCSWTPIEAVVRRLRTEPHTFTTWFGIAFDALTSRGRPR